MCNNLLLNQIQNMMWSNDTPTPATKKVVGSGPLPRESPMACRYGPRDNRWIITMFNGSKVKMQL